MILNLTQHPATPEQKEAGVVDLRGNSLKHLKALLTFTDIPTNKELQDRAHDIAQLVIHNELGEDDNDPIFLQAMIGGAPFFMSFLESALRENHVTPLYAFSERVSEENTDKDGNVVKRNIFKHKGFVNVHVE
ncbi:hypothetical protein [Aliidiomarina quisquiliarum]|uniref:hypothetical protein n=1 Tax=Aliidiomarina quisquiliarum TaxID=2938947 RepID=UPI00208F8405|nr:hypothetical protein [Aliidiomarina quisquiliarum]MCO4319976.1 hypothetical protein [Aliidiomarina quisquiliarum]